MTAESSFASVICGTETLLESERVSINESDIIGVGIPTTDPLPILATGASGYNIKMFPDDKAETVNSADLVDMASFTVHISADITTGIYIDYSRLSCDVLIVFTVGMVHSEFIVLMLTINHDDRSLKLNEYLLPVLMH